MPKIDVKSVPERRGSGYPAPFGEIAKDRVRQRLGDAGGLTQFGVNLLQLPPGAGSSQRHWHSGEDEFVYVVSGEVVLVTDKGEEILRAGDCAAFPKDVARRASAFEQIRRRWRCAWKSARGAPTTSRIYSDIDMKIDKKGRRLHAQGRHALLTSGA